MAEICRQEIPQLQQAEGFLRSRAPWHEMKAAGGTCSISKGCDVTQR